MSDANANADADADAGAGTETAPDANAVPDTEAIPDADAVPDTEAISDADAIPDVDATPDTEAISDVDAMPQTDGDAIFHADVAADADTCSHTEDDTDAISCGDFSAPAASAATDGDICVNASVSDTSAFCSTDASPCVMPGKSASQSDGDNDSNDADDPDAGNGVDAACPASFCNKGKFEGPACASAATDDNICGVSASCADAIACVKPGNSAYQSDDVDDPDAGKGVDAACPASFCNKGKFEGPACASATCKTCASAATDDNIGVLASCADVIACVKPGSSAYQSDDVDDPNAGNCGDAASPTPSDDANNPDAGGGVNAACPTSFGDKDKFETPDCSFPSPDNDICDIASSCVNANTCGKTASCADANICVRSGSPASQSDNIEDPDAGSGINPTGPTSFDNKDKFGVPACTSTMCKNCVSAVSET